MEGAGRPFRLPGMPDQTHARLFGCGSAFFMITIKAAGDDVVPGFAVTSDDRDDMVKGQILSGTLFPTVLAGMMITGVNVRSAEFHVLKVPAHLYILEESQDAGHFDCEAYAVDLPVIFRQDLHLALDEEG